MAYLVLPDGSGTALFHALRMSEGLGAWIVWVQIINESIAAPSYLYLIHSVVRFLPQRWTKT